MLALFLNGELRTWIGINIESVVGCEEKLVAVECSAMMSRLRAEMSSNNIGSQGDTIERVSQPDTASKTEHAEHDVETAFQVSSRVLVKVRQRKHGLNIIRHFVRSARLAASGTVKVQSQSVK
jgi:hypothetical protein